MGAFSDILDLVSLGKSAQEKANLDPEDTKTVASFFQKAKSISSRASKYVMEYPTICSTAISDYDVALAIAKQVEFDCARFVILASGLNPFVRLDKNDTIEAHLSDLVSSYESYSGLRVSITEATEDQIRASEEYMRDSYNKEYKSFKTDSSSVLSIEMTDNYTSGGQVNITQQDIEEPKPYMDQVKEYISIINNPYNGKLKPDLRKDGIAKDISEFIPKPEDPEQLKEWEEANKFFKESVKNGISAVGKVHDDILNSLGKVKPTIINVDFFLIDAHGGQSKVSVPLAIKSNLQFVNSFDMVDLMSKTKTPGSKFHTLIRLTTGELNFFKDIILGLDEAKNDVEREKSIGHTPFYRRLLSNKARFRIKNIGETLSSLKGIVSKKKQKDLPMFTVIVDEQEITNASGIKFAQMLKDRNKFINYFLDTYMLLGLGVVDKDNDVIYFFYSGEESYTTVRISEVGDRASKAGNVSKDISTALANMSRVVAGR